MRLQEAARRQVLADECLVTEFFWAFNWLETQIVRKHGQNWLEGVFRTEDGVEKLDICWPRFALHLEEILGQAVDCTSFSVLCDEPPMRRNLANGAWESSKRRRVNVKNAFSQVPVLRNNLFHGSKSVGTCDRNNVLLRAGLDLIEIIYEWQGEVF